MLKVYYAATGSEENTADFEKLLPLVPGKRREEILGKGSFMQRKLSLYAELIVRAEAVRALGVKNRDVEFMRSGHGKPFLDGFTGFDFNISHSEDALAVAVGGVPVGVDIEKVKSARLQVARRFFTPSEQEYVMGDGALSDRRFFEVWTKKEAYIKYTGAGLSARLDCFDVFDESISPFFSTFWVDKSVISVFTEKQETPELIKLSERETIELISPLMQEIFP